MTQTQKERIDRMSYEQMLRIWRFAPLGSPVFQGKTGDYFNASMRRKRYSQCRGAHTAASKRIGWDE